MATHFSDLDHAHMHRALELAWQGRFSTSPNPRVGCVIAHGEQIVGQGFHVKAGEPHAEVHALRQAGTFAQAQPLTLPSNRAPTTAGRHLAPNPYVNQVWQEL